MNEHKKIKLNHNSHFRNVFFLSQTKHEEKCRWKKKKKSNLIKKCDIDIDIYQRGTMMH